jgi:hypothetical protein
MDSSANIGDKFVNGVSVTEIDLIRSIHCAGDRIHVDRVNFCAFGSEQFSCGCADAGGSSGDYDTLTLEPKLRQ